MIAYLKFSTLYIFTFTKVVKFCVPTCPISAGPVTFQVPFNSMEWQLSALMQKKTQFWPS